jgi:hypothetical protein
MVNPNHTLTYASEIGIKYALTVISHVVLPFEPVIVDLPQEDFESRDAWAQVDNDRERRGIFYTWLLNSNNARNNRPEAFQ